MTDHSKVPPPKWQNDLTALINKRRKELKCPHCGGLVHEKSDIQKRIKSFQNKIAKFTNQYPSEMLKEFYYYWSEKSDGGRKMRFEKEKVFDVSRRLVTWDKRRKDKKYESFASQDDRRLKESFEKTAILRYGKDIPFQGGDTKALDIQKPTNWGNPIAG